MSESEVTFIPPGIIWILFMNDHYLLLLCYDRWCQLFYNRKNWIS